jgi:formylglycine-generating enzyme required for sulfatase activity
MRLPTEAQWEKAASWDDGKGVKQEYPWGDGFDQNRCNTRESDIGGTTPVDHYGKKGASPCGAWDMAGNVGEWCSSLYKDYPYDPEDGRENPSDFGSRVLRGGSYDYNASYARCAARSDNLPNSLWLNFGFRVCVVGASPISRSGS